MDAQELTLFLTGIELTDSRMGPAAPTIPAAPTGLAVTSGASSLTLDWTNGDTYSLVAIDRAADSADFTALTTVAGNVITYEDTTALAGITYTYKVRGLKATFPSPYSNTDSGELVTSTSFSVAFDGDATSGASSSSIAPIQVTTNDKYIIGGWIRPTAVNVEYHFAEMSSLQAAQVFDLWISATGKIRLTALVDATYNTDSLVGPSISANADQFFLLVLDGTNYRLSLNAGTEATMALTSTFVGTGGTMTFGNSPANEVGFPGSLDEVFFCKNPADIEAAVTLITTTIYNSGTGLRYADVSGANKTTMGLVSWWGFDEASGTREDLNSTVDLTPSVAGVTQSAPLVG